MVNFVLDCFLLGNIQFPQGLTNTFLKRFLWQCSRLYSSMKKGHTEELAYLKKVETVVGVSLMIMMLSDFEKVQPQIELLQGPEFSLLVNGSLWLILHTMAVHSLQNWPQDICYCCGVLHCPPIPICFSHVCQDFPQKIYQCD